MKCDSLINKTLFLDCSCHDNSPLANFFVENKDFFITGLSLRAGGRGFSPATKRVAPSYFYWKIEEK